MNDGQILQQLRASLLGEGSKAVRLEGGYFRPEIVKAAIDEFQRFLVMQPILEEKLSPLQRLAVDILLDSAGITAKTLKEPA